MSFTELLLIAIGLAMDSVTVSVSCGLILQNYKHTLALRIGLYMGVFQGAMVAIGWFLGSSFQEYMVSVDHWVAFGVLTFLGIRMIYQQITSNNEFRCFDPTNHRVLAGLGLATSIDALAVGVTLGLVDILITYAAVTIGVVSLVLSTLAVWVASKFRQGAKLPFELIGGVILILIGIRILIEHLTNGL